MDQANGIRVYQDDSTAEQLTESLLDMLRYNDDLDMTFAAFESLVRLKSQDLVFMSSLRELRILGTNEEAKNFMLASQDVSEFRRLYKWLLIEDKCVQCIKVTKKLQKWCQAVEGRELLRSLQIEGYVFRVLDLRTGDTTPTLLELFDACLELISNFVTGCPGNQLDLAGQIKQSLLPLLEMPQMMQSAAVCITEIVRDNQHLSINFSGLLTKAVGRIQSNSAMARSVKPLKLLEALLVVDAYPVAVSQIEICKGSLVSRDLIETEGDLRLNEWGDGPALSRTDAVRAVLKSDAANGPRAQKALEYYNMSLTVLGICARGKMPTTELLCASVIPFTECISRIYEVYEDPDVQSSLPQHQLKDPIVNAKAGIMCFFREVFIDTNSEHIIRSLKSMENGLWSVEKDDEDNPGREPICTHLAVEIKKLFGGKSLDQQLREYLFEQIIMMYIQYACVISPNDISDNDERKVIRSFYEDQLKFVPSLMIKDDKHFDWNPRETCLLKQLISVSESWTAGKQANMTAKDLAELQEASKLTYDHSQASPNAARWNGFVDAAVTEIRLTLSEDTLIH